MFYSFEITVSFSSLFPLQPFAFTFIPCFPSNSWSLFLFYFVFNNNIQFSVHINYNHYLLGNLLYARNCSDDLGFFIVYIFQLSKLRPRVVNYIVLFFISSRAEIWPHICLTSCHKYLGWQDISLGKGTHCSNLLP